jgi:hypothetical protein
MPLDLQSVVREIYRLAISLGVHPPNATRLVKLVYLADLEWRRTHEGEPLSDLHWRFHHYGPYASEFSPLLGGEDVELTELTEGKTAKRLVFEEDQLQERQTPESVSSLLQKIIKEWGDSNINLLLNHVYFDTEPMEGAKRGEALDFSAVKPRTLVKLSLDTRVVAGLRADLSKHVERLGLVRQELYRPTVDLRGWEEDDDTSTPRLPIGARVKF